MILYAVRLDCHTYHGIDAVFTDKAQAESYMEREGRGEPYIEEFELDKEVQ